MPNQQIIHPQMMQLIARYHYPNTVTIQSLTVTYNAANEPITSYVDDPLLIELAAYIEPVQNKVEIRRADQTIVENGWNIVLADYYPTIKENDQATDDLGRIHNIIQADIDAFQTQTTLITEIING